MSARQATRAVGGCQFARLERHLSALAGDSRRETTSQSDKVALATVGVFRRECVAKYLLIKSNPIEPSIQAEPIRSPPISIVALMVLARARAEVKLLDSSRIWHPSHEQLRHVCRRDTAGWLASTTPTSECQTPVHWPTSERHSVQVQVVVVVDCDAHSDHHMAQDPSSAPLDDEFRPLSILKRPAKTCPMELTEASRGLFKRSNLFIRLIDYIAMLTCCLWRSTDNKLAAD